MSQPYYITDNNNGPTTVIRLIDSSGNISTPSISSTDPEYASQGGIFCPWGCAIDPTGRFLYVVDECAELVYQIDTTTFVAVCVFGQTGGSGALGWPFPPRIDIYDMACDSRGNLAIVDVQNKIVIGVNTNSTPQVMCGVTIAVGDAAQIAGTTVAATYGCSFDSADNLYVTQEGDGFNNTGTGNIVYIVDAVTGAESIVFGTASTRQPNSGDGGPPLSAILDNPFQIAIDNVNGLAFIVCAGEAPVTPENNSIRVVNISGSTKSVGGVSIAPNTIETIFTAAAGSSSIWYSMPDGQGNVYVCDVGPRGAGCWLHLLNSSGGYSVVAGSASGTCGFSGDGGPATSALIGEAFAIALAPSSNPSLCSCGPQPVGNPLI
jgi:hypothetical protein